MNGKELRKIIKNSGIKALDLIEKSGIPEGTFFKIYKKEVVEDHYLEALKKAGLKLPETIHNNPTATPELTAQILGLVQQSIEMVKDEIAQINKNNDHLLDANKALTNLLNKVMDDGKIIIQKPQESLVNIQDLFPSAAEYKKALKFINESPEKVSICISDAEGKIINVNDEFTKQTGYTLEEMKGRKPGKVLQRDNTNQDGINRIRAAIKNHKYFEGEILNYAKDGTEIVCKLTLSPVKDKHGKLEKFISMAVFSKVNVLKYN